MAFNCLPVEAQIKAGSWREHLSYRNVKQLSKIDNELYCVTERGLFIYNVLDNSLSKISKLNGLSDFNISSIESLPSENLIIIGYANGNIDIIADNQISNYEEIKNKLLFGSKSINNITFYNSLAYLSCGFGIVVFDYQNLEVKATYKIGQDGQNIVVNDIAIGDGIITAATENGVYQANISNPNLLDYRNWERIQDLPNFNQSFSNAKRIGNRLYLVNKGNSGDSIFYLENNRWRFFNTGTGQRVRNLREVNNRLMIAYAYEIFVFDENNRLMQRVNSYQVNETFKDVDEDMDEVGAFPMDVQMDKEGIIWVADDRNGLIRLQNGTANSYYPQGPYNNHAYSLYINQGEVWMTGGGIKGNNQGKNHNLWYRGELYHFSDGQWKNYRFSETWYDFVQVLQVPDDDNQLYVASWGKGLFKIQQDEIIESFGKDNYTTHPLQSALEPNTPYYRIGSVALDDKDNLWVSNSNVSHLLSVRKPDGDWTGYDLGDKIDRFVMKDMIVARNNHKWAIAQTANTMGGILVFDENGTIENKEDDRYKIIQVRDQDQKLISSDVYSLAEDKDGYIWVGTNEGVYVYYNPENVFAEEGFYASSILIPRNDGTNIADRLLETETITDIAIDGANRKWFGTRSSGAYLFSEDGLGEIQHFRFENSPLLDNNIYDIEIDGQSGEVFIATTKGLISYRGTATEAGSYTGKTYVFPNPVRQDYNGPVIIKGLIEDSNVKITDISGNLVYETTSQGGQAIWYAKNLDGKKVSTGVYLVFCTNDDGSETRMTKVLVIN